MISEAMGAVVDGVDGVDWVDVATGGHADRESAFRVVDPTDITRTGPRTPRHVILTVWVVGPLPRAVRR